MILNLTPYELSLRYSNLTQNHDQNPSFLPTFLITGILFKNHRNLIKKSINSLIRNKFELVGIADTLISVVTTTPGTAKALGLVGSCQELFFTLCQSFPFKKKNCR